MQRVPEMTGWRSRCALPVIGGFALLPFRRRAERLSARVLGDEGRVRSRTPAGVRPRSPPAKASASMGQRH
jgi:hypothetical protein